MKNHQKINLFELLNMCYWLNNNEFSNLVNFADVIETFRLQCAKANEQITNKYSHSCRHQRISLWLTRTRLRFFFSVISLFLNFFDRRCEKCATRSIRCPPFKIVTIIFFLVDFSVSLFASFACFGFSAKRTFANTD